MNFLESRLNNANRTEGDFFVLLVDLAQSIAKIIL